MKRLFWIFILILWYCASVIAVTINKDSLIYLAKITTDKSLKVKVYRDLADIYMEKPEESYFLKMLYKSAKEAKNKELELFTLTELACSYVKEGGIDSVHYYMDLIKKEVNAQTENKYLSIIRIRLFDFGQNQGKKEAEKALDFELDLFRSADMSNIYIQIEKAYISGQSLVECQKYEEASDFFEHAYQLANELSDPEDVRYRTATGWLYANNFGNVGSPEKCVKLLEEILELYRSTYEKIYLGKRPYYNIEGNYLHCYASLLMYARALPKEKLNHYIDEIRTMGACVTDPFDRYNYLLAMCNYYLFTEDYPNALLNLDEQIEMLPTFTPIFLPGKHRLQSEIYEELGDYLNALKKYKIFVQLKDSFSSKERQKQLNTLQVEYEVDTLKFEKANLESRNKQILLITLSFILFLAIAICIYLYYHLKKEKQMKMKLYDLNQKAGESELMKTEFMNSMCHEIRTPLNAIVGFSGIVVDEECDSESKAEFGELIQTNAALLTSLIDDMLVVSNLDSSCDLLPCEVANVNDICREEFGKVRCKNLKPIEYVLKIPEKDIVFSTNAKHLSLVLENLLNNASKFTQEGYITLELLKSENSKSIQIQVSDTGCGIPLDKQEVVFERFMKLDSFVQGNGLGLFLCKLIVSRLMGEIYVDSSYTAGARFIITLPMLK